MAKLLYSALIDGIRGRAAGVVFSANAAGPHVKRFSPPIIKNTAAQVGRRATFSVWASGWRGITIAQRNAWIAYAAAPAQQKFDSLGNPYFLNGFQWFVSYNSNRNLVGRAQLSAAPVLAIPPAPTIGALVVTAPGTAACSQAITVASFGAADMVIDMNWTRGNSRLIATEKNYKFVKGVQNGALVAATNLGDLSVLFGTLTAGTYWISRVYAQNTEGRRSTFASATVVAV